MGKSHIKTFTTDPHTIEIHELAELTPNMTELQQNALTDSIENIGQLNPIVMYQGKLIDGRHRLKSIKSLRLNQITYTNLNSQMTLDEVKEIILNGYEQRRHQSITQKAISAYKEFEEIKRIGEQKITQGNIAEKYSVHTNDISSVRKLHSLTSELVIETLFNGGKIKMSNGKRTDNLRALVKNFQVIADEATEGAFKIPQTVTDDEWSMINQYVDNLSDNHSNPVLKALANSLLKKAGAFN